MMDYKMVEYWNNGIVGKESKLLNPIFYSSNIPIFRLGS
jgi:hypothetical protein